MKPTRLHYFYAQNWPARILIVGVAVLAVVLMAVYLGRPPQITRLDAETKTYWSLLAVALFLGLCVAALVGPFVLGPLYHYRAELNGYPFRPGDQVEILVGPNRGRRAAVIEVREQRGNLQVALGDIDRLGAKRFFHFAQVIKLTDGGS